VLEPLSWEPPRPLSLLPGLTVVRLLFTSRRTVFSACNDDQTQKQLAFSNAQTNFAIALSRISDLTLAMTIRNVKFSSRDRLKLSPILSAEHPTPEI